MVTLGMPLCCSHIPHFIVFVCCFHGNVLPHSAAYRWNGPKSIENSRESYFCSLGSQCGSNRQEMLRGLIYHHMDKKSQLGPVLQSAVTRCRSNNYRKIWNIMGLNLLAITSVASMISHYDDNTGYTYTNKYEYTQRYWEQLRSHFYYTTPADFHINYGNKCKGKKP